MAEVNDKSMSATRIDEVLITPELNGRPTRPPDYEAQSQAMLDLADELRTNPGGVLQKVAQLAMKLCNAGSAGISILEKSPECDVFRWHAIAGSFAPNLGGSLPRDASPCGVVIALIRVQLFNQPERFYPELRGVSPRIYETLVAPWPSEGTPGGTLWVLAHTPEHRFDAEDARIVEILARFASGAYQTVLALERAKASQVDLEKRVEESAYLLSDAFKVLRQEMEDRAQADTKRKMAETALRESENLVALGRMSTAIARQINNPLDAVSNLLYMAEYAASVLEARQYLARAQTELARVGRMTKETGRFDRGSTRPTRAHLDEIMESALSLHEGRIRHARIAIQSRYRPHRPLLCFTGEIRQVVVNLVANAIDAMKETAQPRLLVRVCAAQHRETRQAGIRLTVADTGAGMSAAVRQRIFEPFFTAWVPPGAGLGLWVGQEIVSKHKGVVKVRSARNMGTVFVVFLPYLDPPH
jgi:signal transduction histidine kinase